ncbi:MAG: hypothetical protein RMJ84_00030 [Sandaracinaceae bacterium]|nr:hypothetical protein [Sandaracinaceae bacterium]
MRRFVNSIQNWVFVQAFVGLFLWLFPVKAHACSCRYPSFEEELRESSAIFEGRVEEIRVHLQEGVRMHRVRFSVTQAWRGVGKEKVWVETPALSSMCGYRFEVGQYYLVFGYGNNPTRVSLCSRTRPIEEAREDRLRLGAGHVPVEIEKDQKEEGPPSEEVATQPQAQSPQEPQPQGQTPPPLPSMRDPQRAYQAGCRSCAAKASSLFGFKALGIFATFFFLIRWRMR